MYEIIMKKVMSKYSYPSNPQMQLYQNVFFKRKLKTINKILSTSLKALNKKKKIEMYNFIKSNRDCVDMKQAKCEK